MSTPIQAVPGTLPYSCYPATPQQLNVDIITLAQFFLSQNFPGIYVGPTSSPPPADQRDRAWLNSDNQRIYLWISGAWQREYDVPANGGENRIIRISANDYNTEQGGDAVTVGVGPSVGPLWIEDTDFAGRVPIGIGTIPTSSPAASIASIGDTQDSLGNSGQYAHTLTEAEGALGSHIHAFGKSNNAAGPNGDDAYFRQLGMQTVPSYTGTYITGSDGVHQDPLTQADLFTLPPGNTGAGVTATAFQLMQPYLGRIFVKRTGRIYVPPPY